MGFQGIILAYAKEIVLEKGTAIEEGKSDEAKDVEAWKKGTLETVRLADQDGYAALKYVHPYLKHHRHLLTDGASGSQVLAAQPCDS